jgi:GNAT superfamily N-acetyltransferase
MTELVYGTADERDSEQLLALINLVQPHVPWDARHLHWQFFAPAAGPARLYVVRDAGRIVSLYVAVPHILEQGGQARRSFMIQDVMTHPAYRGGGFLHELGRVCLSEIQAAGDLGHTFPNERSEGSFRRNGWTELCRVPQWSASVVEKGSFHAAIEPWAGPFDADTDALWAEAGLDTGVRRDSAYLQWRYSKPGVHYQRYKIDGNRGLLVLKPYRGTKSLLHICELIVRAPSRVLIGDVLRFCFSTARMLGAEALTAWLPPEHPYAAAFADAGLLFNSSNRTVFVTGPRDILPALCDERRWHLTHGDSDVY